MSTVLVAACLSHWHEAWESGARYNYLWYQQSWVSDVNSFYCDDDCSARLLRAPTIDREFKALVDLLNQTTGGPRGVYRGAFEGLDAFKQGGGAVSRQAASQSTWKNMGGWDSILTAHTSELTLCTNLKLDGNQSFTRFLCYDNIIATDDGPIYPTPEWSVIRDCCLKFNRTVGHAEDAFFWTDEYALDIEGTDAAGFELRSGVMVGGMGLVVGRYGRILRTIDGGHSWTRIESPTSEPPTRQPGFPPRGESQCVHMFHQSNYM